MPEDKELDEAPVVTATPNTAATVAAPASRFDDLVFKICASGDTTALAKLLDKEPQLLTEVDPVSGGTLAHWCALHGRLLLIKLLQERGAALDACIEENGMQPVHWACSRGHLATTQYLICIAGIPADVPDAAGTTPLMHAAQGNHPRLVFWLGTTYPDCLPKVDNNGDTALHWAACASTAAEPTFALVCTDRPHGTTVAFARRQGLAHGSDTPL